MSSMRDPHDLECRQSSRTILRRREADALVAQTVLRQLNNIHRRDLRPNVDGPIPQPSPERLLSSLSSRPFDIPSFIHRYASGTGLLGIEKLPEKEEKTVFYLAYGSNLSSETFKGVRGIKPISQINVHAPELDLTFDLPGIPYQEPCFAGTNYRATSSKEPSYAATATTRLVRRQPPERTWTKGLIGVVYEVTPSDYAHIIATEGGGAGYVDIVTTCHPLPKGLPTTSSSSKSVPTTPFRAHTLLSPPPSSPTRTPRQPGYAQPSRRYLKLITDGAAEHSLPSDYQAYLQSLHAYTITTTRQRIGATIYLAFWMPILSALLGLSETLADETGRMPRWWVQLMGVVFALVWGSYDGFFRRWCGDGERTEGDDDDDDDDDDVEFENRGEE